MPSDDGAEPMEWGASSGRFGSDSADAIAPEPSPDRTAPTRRGPARSGSPLSASKGSTFGRKGSNGGSRARRSGRGANRSSFDDPFGPVVGAPADSFGDDEEPESRNHEGADAPSFPRSDEEWTSEARSVLLRHLALGPRSRHQLQLKLAERNVPASVASALLDRFEEVQLIDDAEFARMWVRTRTAAKSLSRSSLRRELADKGIDPESAEDALLQVSDEDEYEQAATVVRRKLRSGADLSDRAVRDKEVRRLVGVLARKGYSPGAAFSIVKDVVADEQASD